MLNRVRPVGPRALRRRSRAGRGGGRQLRPREQLAGAMKLPVLQSADARIKQTLASRAHTMSMLHDMKIGKPLEANDLWISF